MFTFLDLGIFVAVGNFKSENLIKSSKSPFVLSKFCHKTRIWKIIFHVCTSTPAEIRKIANLLPDKS
jgi:hypothetical protein